MKMSTMNIHDKDGMTAKQLIVLLLKCSCVIKHKTSVCALLKKFLIIEEVDIDIL